MAEDSVQLTQDERTRRAARRLLKWVLSGLGALVVLYLLLTAPFWLFAAGWYDSTRVGRYREFLDEMPSELAREMPQSIPSNAHDVRMHYHAGMLQGRPWLELRFVVPVEDARRSAESIAASKHSPEEQRISLSAWSRRLATLEHRERSNQEATGMNWFLLAEQSKSLGFTGVMIDESSGEVVYFLVMD